MIKIFVAGHEGMVGSAIIRQLQHNPDNSVITAPRFEVDLSKQTEVTDFFECNNFDQVYLAAAKVGGIHANNSYPADFIYQNLMIQNNVIHSAYITGVEKLLFLGSSCIYPKLSKQPISESSLMTGPLEPTNEAYAIAKIAGIKMCESYNRQYKTDYRSVMPTNLYGPGDNFHDTNSHVIPALIRRFHNAKEDNLSEVQAWGTGAPLREFLYVDDMASASVYVMNLSSSVYWTKERERQSHLNVGTGLDCSIKELTESIAKVVGFRGDIKWDSSKPDGAPRKLLSTKELALMGWTYETPLLDGLKATYDWYLKNIQVARI